MNSPVFVGGCQRSGTTLLASLIGGHPDYLTLPEAPFKWRLLARIGRDDPKAIAAALRAEERLAIWGLRRTPDASVIALGLPAVMADLSAAYSESLGVAEPPRHFVDHTTENLRNAAALLSAFPDARFIHVLRDGRAATASVLPLDWGPTDAVDAARWWALSVGEALAAEEYLKDRVLRVRYEDLLDRPLETIRGLARFLGVDASLLGANGGFDVPAYTQNQHTRVGGALDPSRIDAWRNSLSPRQVELFEARAGGMLAHLGYEPVVGLAARPLALRERVSRSLLAKPRHLVVNRICRRLRFRRTVNER